MACTLLAKFNEQFPSLFSMVSTEELQRQCTANEGILGGSELGEKFYFAIGSALSANGEWNSMTYKQLEHEARVLGLLGPFENHSHSAFKLRLMLACEAKRNEEEGKVVHD
ncbi:hypothetical protein HBI56_111650 [Parastagonospora nodorum]|uniref:Uncharacterized protein n=1 Tax=Phaeosphaeria nodorum (strain SN15 / ATCC MYA-4574 / FGSC 10173) TaxID=321614 RepID=A0A7U2ETZ5_PHANO|nr:hypothetical protein HBH56_044270 [Parastagonospora nodorum]QRC92777.1 hypothetical protein JI435_305750 [Parastagonospora nodorum SN15]KAH3932894.1 hypothetical protein HBH54_072020 [Parastagonospora nodorum]KAH3946308.1 hypothetical protein HBH53_131210 [Parastagonospora nodorum]KAH3973245.1 hypothetical protein HBH52_144090 [Parastagonospora nodorum]